MDMTKQYNRETFMLSRYTGNCSVCGLTMPIGTEIAFGGKYSSRHVRCFSTKAALMESQKYD